MRPKSQRAKREEAQRFNEGAAWIILSQPERYAGLPFEWAELWRKRHGQPKQQDDGYLLRMERDLDSLEGRYERRERKTVAARRARWMKRQWKVSRKGNPYTTARGNIHVVLYPYGAMWRFRVKSMLNEETFVSVDGYAEPEEAKAAAFDVVLYLRSKSGGAHPAMVRKEI